MDRNEVSDDGSTNDGSTSHRIHIVRAAILLALVSVPLAGGWLNLLDVQRDGVDGVQGLDGASGVAVSPDGAYLFATAAVDDSLVVFRRDATEESLDFYHVFQDGVSGVFGLDGATATTMSPDQRHVYATAAGDHALTVFRRDASAESFAFVADYEDNVGPVFGLGGASDVAVTPDDRHVVVTAAHSMAVTLFRRDASLDDLTFVDIEQDWIGLGGASGVAVNDDMVFVAGARDNALAVFRRDASMDDLAFVENHVNGFEGVEGLEGAAAVAVSPDDRFVYVASSVDDAVAVFEADGAGYVFRGVYRDGVGGVDGLDGASALAIDPTGRLLFVAGRGEAALAVFQRGNNGELTPLQVLRDGVDGIDGLSGAVSLAVSPDALHVYVAADTDDAVAALRILTLLFADDFELGNTSAWTTSTEP